MRFLKGLFRFYIEASIHVALSVAFLTALTFIKFQLEFDLVLCAVACLATITSYNFMKYGTKAKSYFIVSTLYLRIIQILSFACFAVMGLLMLQLSFRVWVVLGISGVLSTLYALPLLPGHNSFRSLHGFKVYMVAFCWALITVIIPVVDDDQRMNLNVWIEAAQRFLMVLALIIPFDIRDLKADSISLGTLPQRLGVARAKQIGYTLVLVFFGLDFFKTGIGVKEMPYDAAIAVLMVAALFFAKQNQPKYYCGFFVESIPIVWFLLYYLF